MHIILSIYPNMIFSRFLLRKLDKNETDIEGRSNFRVPAQDIVPFKRLEMK